MLTTKPEKNMITALINVKKRPDVVTIIPLYNVPEDDIDCMVQHFIEKYGQENVTVKRGNELQESISNNRALYDEMGRLLEGMTF